MRRRLALWLLLIVAHAFYAYAQTPSLPGRVPMLDAHNCYPYEGKWADRIDRALSTGFPVAIEQDLVWNGTGSSVAHATGLIGGEPTLRAYFFEHVRPIVERALRENQRDRWPLIVLHFDFKDNLPEHLRSVWKLLGEYEAWLTTAPKTANPSTLSPLNLKPILVITEDNDAQEQVFFRDVPIGSNLRLFGSAKTNNAFLQSLAHEQRLDALVSTAPEILLNTPPTNYRRWWNNSWFEVEHGGASEAGEWTPADNSRLQALVNHAHRLGYWIRFYTLDGYAPNANMGWDANYNFGSLPAARIRWAAAQQAGVDLIATDQYEELRVSLARGATPGGK